MSFQAVHHQVASAFIAKADMCSRAKSGHRHDSITSLESARSLSGMMNPSALAALRLITSSNLVGCWKEDRPMSALGHKRTYAVQKGMSTLTPTAGMR